MSSFIMPYLYMTLALLVLVLSLLPRVLSIARAYFPSYSNLPGPAADSLLQGSLPTLGSETTGEPTLRWFEKYGSTVVWRNSMSRPDLMTRDPSFVHAIYHSGDFDLGKPQISLTRKLGMHAGLTATQGEAHRRLRRAMMPAFGTPAVKDMWPDMLDKVALLKDRVMSECKDGPVTVSATKYMQWLAVEIIGKCGFGHDFGVIANGRPSEMEQVLGKLVGGLKTMSWADHLDVFGARFKLSARQKSLDQCRKQVNAMANDLLRKRRAEVMAETPKKRDAFGKDIVSVLLRANLASDLKASHRLSDEEVRHMVPLTLIGATHTTHQTMAWGLHYLASNRNVQDHLRKELETAADDWDTVTSLPYLDAVTREIIRLAPANVTQTRTAARKTVVRLSEPVRGRDGRMMDRVVVDKGTSVTIPIDNVNTYGPIYGDDPFVFRPERHLTELPRAKELGGQWGNNVTFAGGDRGCIGFRLAVAEIKAMLCVFVRAFGISQPDGLQLRKMGMYSGVKTTARADRPLDVPGIPTSLLQ